MSKMNVLTLPIVENPEIGRSYLIRRFVSGKLQNRFQPGRILKREKYDDDDQMLVGYRISIEWLYDGEVEEEVFEHHGSVRELSTRYVVQEYANLQNEYYALEKKMKTIEYFAFHDLKE